MYYILLQLKTKGNGDDVEPKGSIWSTSFTKKFWKDNKNGDTFEKFLEREKSEILAEVKSYTAVQQLMEKWHSANKDGDIMECARKFFKREANK
jgi:hypothetical protein